MFGAIGRWFRSLSHFISGRVDNAARDLDADPTSMRSQYDSIIKDKTRRIQQYKDAIAGLIAQQETKLGSLKTLGEEVAKLEQLKAGALAKAQSVVSEMQERGAAKEQIHGDADYQKCLSAYNDFSSTLAEKQARISEIEKDVGEYGTRIEDHKIQLQEQVRDLDKIRSEKADAVAEVIGAQQEKELNDALSGIGEDTAEARLDELRRTRAEIKAGARVSRELAGTDGKASEAEFLDYARKAAGSSEFDKLIGLADTADAAPPVAEPKAAEGGAKEGPASLPE